MNASKNILLCLLLSNVCSFSYAQTVRKTMKRLPDTGVKTGYSAIFGEDNDYQINPPFFILHGNGTVTDTITGLMWQHTDGGEMTIEKAGLYCDTLTLAGYNDWRLPDIHELFSILNHERTNPALDPTSFGNTAAAYWWSADRQANDSNKVWVTNAGGGAGNHPKTETISAGGTKRFHVRAVRSASSPEILNTRFQDNGDGTVTDQITGLTWLNRLQQDTMDWEQALRLADSSSAAGKTDWRLPNIKEMQSVSDQKLFLPCISKQVLNFTGNRKFWTSTTLSNQSDKAWFLDSRYGICTYEAKPRRLDVWLVRGGNESTLKAAHPLKPMPKVWPNPFRDCINMENAAFYKNFQLMNAKGQKVFEGIDINRVDLSFLEPGNYVLVAIGRDGLITQHILKL